MAAWVGRKSSMRYWYICFKFHVTVYSQVNVLSMLEAAS